MSIKIKSLPLKTIYISSYHKPTNPGSLPTKIQREIEQDLKKLQTEILRAQIDQAYQQMKAE